MKPLLMNSEMVNATLEGMKTQFRKILIHPEIEQYALDYSPYLVGDILYVRETFAAFTRPHTEYGDCDEVEDKLDDLYLEMCGYPDIVYKADNKSFPNKWRPSIHIPKWAARIHLKVTNVRVERVKDINCQDAWEEGIEHLPWDDAFGESSSATMDYIDDGNIFCPADPVASFRTLWQSLYSKESWDNDYVFVYEFERVEG